MSKDEEFVVGWDMASGESETVKVLIRNGSVDDPVVEVVGLAFHRNSFMMAACACGFAVRSIGLEHARASYRLQSHERRCEVARRIQDAFDRVAQRAINEARHD